MKKFLVISIMSLVSAFALAAAAQSISPDGSTITPQSGGSLVTTDGTWTFGTQTMNTAQYNGTAVYLNGQQRPEAWGIKMSVYSGKLYQENGFNAWWLFQNDSWSQANDPTPSQAANPCANYYTSSVPVPTGYGAAYDLLSSAKELLVNVDCSGTPKLSVGSGLQNQYIYKQGYIYQSAPPAGGWQPLNLTSASQLVSSAWYVGTASANLSGQIPTAWTYVVGYVCTWVTSLSTGSGQTPAGVWQCGCHDTACATPAWQLQAFEQSASSGGGGAAAGTRNWAFFDNMGSDTGAWAQLNSGWAAKPFDGVSSYTDIGDSYWEGTASWSPTPHTHFLNVQYGTPGSGGWPGSLDLNAAASGAYDDQWYAWLKADSDAANAAGAPISVVRIWQEINGNWMIWSQGSPATIIAAWRNMATQVRKAIPNAVIEWNLSAGGPWNGCPGSCGFDLYPGDDLVDVIGIDGYEGGPPGSYGSNQTWSWFLTTNNVNLQNTLSFAKAHNKLFAVSETATGNCDGSWLTNLANFFDAAGASGAYIAYYDQGSGGNGGNLLYTTSGEGCPASTLQAALNASSFGTKKFGGTWSKVLRPQ